MSLVIIVLGLGALIAWTLYATGVFENGALFFAVGALPGSETEVDPTLMLGLHAVLLVLVGYIFGFMHGSLHRAVQHHLKHAEPRREEQPVISSAQPKKARTKPQLGLWVKRLLAVTQKHTRAHGAQAKQSASRSYAQMRRHGKQVIALAAALAIWAKPRLAVAAKRTARGIGHGVKKTVEVIEKIWVWFRYP